MKTKIEFGEHVVIVEEIDGVITVKAEKDEEVIEEFSIETEESEEGQGQSQSQDDDEVQGFDDFDKEEEDDFEEEGQDQAQEEEEEDEEAQELPALESFDAFSRRRK